jgi:hypothetical protein
MLKEKVYIYCHRPSASANELKRALKRLGVRAIRLYGVRPPAAKGSLCINWGCSEVRFRDRFRAILNGTDKVALATSKVKSLAKLHESEIPSVRITKDKEEALKWLKKGYKVLGRRDGLSNGKGITLFEKDNSPHVDFYARVFPKTHEFRVHVVGKRGIDLVEKKAKKGTDENRLIRTYDNGWIYAHQGLSLSDQRDVDAIYKLGADAISALDLDFGACDILCTLDDKAPRRVRKAIVCEVNSAPGLENRRTIDAYATGIKQLLAATSEVAKGGA